MEDCRVSTSFKPSDMNYTNPERHPSPTPPSKVAVQQSRISDSVDLFSNKINENNQEAMDHLCTKPTCSNCRASAKNYKLFLEPTVSAAPKLILQKKKILVENSKILNSCQSRPEEGPNSATLYSSSIRVAEENPSELVWPCGIYKKAFPHLGTPASSSHIPDTPVSSGISCLEDFDPSTSSLPYDPVNNYLTPRPQYLRYRPNRQLEWALRYKKYQDDEESPVSRESNIKQVGKDRHFSEEENLCILSSGDDSCENQENFSESNQENSETTAEEEAEESQQDDDDGDRCQEEEKGLNFRHHLLAIIFILLLGSFSVWLMNWSACSSPHTLPDKIRFQGNYVARRIEVLPDAFHGKCSKVKESCTRKDQTEALQDFAAYLCTVLFQSNASHQAHSGPIYPASTIQRSNENSCQISKPQVEMPPFVDDLSILGPVGDQESNERSSEITGKQESSAEFETLERISEDNKLQETRANEETGEAENDPPESSEPLAVQEDHDNARGEAEYELPENSKALEVPEDVDDNELTGGANHIGVGKPEMVPRMTGHEDYEENNNEDLLAGDTDKQLKESEGELNNQQSWLLKNESKISYVIGIFAALPTVLTATLCICYGMKRRRMGGTEDIGTPFLSCEDEITEVTVPHLEASFLSRLPDGRIDGIVPPKAVSEHHVAQTRRHATSSLYCNEVVEVDLSAPSKRLISSPHSTKSGEANPEVYSRRRSRRRSDVLYYTNHEVVTPSSENPTTESHSYGSFYFQEKFKGRHGDAEMMSPPLRRSSRLRNQIRYPL